MVVSLLRLCSDIHAMLYVVSIENRRNEKLTEQFMNSIVFKMQILHFPITSSVNETTKAHHLVSACKYRHSNAK